VSGKGLFCPLHLQRPGDINKFSVPQDWGSQAKETWSAPAGGPSYSQPSYSDYAAPPTVTMAKRSPVPIVIAVAIALAVLAGVVAWLVVFKFF
jgi:hypothetical protein